MSAPASFAFVATESVIRAFEKYAHEREFNDFISALQDRAVAVSIMAIGQRDDVLSRWLGGRAQELLEIVGAFSERKILRETDEFLGQPAPDNPLKGLDL